MNLNKTYLYDSMEKQLEKLLEQKTVYELDNTHEKYKNLVALFIAHGVLLTITEEFVTQCERLDDENNLSEDLELLHVRILAGLRSTDGDRLRSGDHDYHITSFKECITNFVDLSSEESEMAHNALTTELWESSMNYFRQIQTFYEAKVSF